LAVRSISGHGRIGLGVRDDKNFAEEATVRQVPTV
jgi:hypothetical protein